MAEFATSNQSLDYDSPDRVILAPLPPFPPLHMTDERSTQQNLLGGIPLTFRTVAKEEKKFGYVVRRFAWAVTPLLSAQGTGRHDTAIR
jgi:hypothetical protein